MKKIIFVILILMLPLSLAQTIEVDYNRIEDIVEDNTIQINDMENLLELYCSNLNLTYRTPNIYNDNNFLEVNGSVNPFLIIGIRNAVSNEFDRGFKDQVQDWLLQTLLPQTQELNALKDQTRQAQANEETWKIRFQGLNESIAVNSLVVEKDIEILKDKLFTYQLLVLTFLSISVLTNIDWIKTILKKRKF